MVVQQYRPSFPWRRGAAGQTIIDAPEYRNLLDIICDTAIFVLQNAHGNAGKVESYYHLLLVFTLRFQPSLDALSCFDERFPLCFLFGPVCENSG